MPYELKTPGVYIQEANAFPQSVGEAPTAIVAFIGVTTTTPGPSFHQIFSLRDYQNLFGEETSTTDGELAYLGASLRLFYENGGANAYVCSIATSTGGLSKAHFLAALSELRTMPEPTLIAFPDLVLLTEGQDEVIAAALQQCRDLSNRFCIIDVSAADTLTTDDRIAAFRKLVGTKNLSYGAVYGPWLEISDGNQTRMIPASGAIAGIYTEVDSQFGVFKAPANVSVKGVIGLSQQINDAQQQNLNVDSVDGKSINVIRNFADRGIIVWGARTLAGNDNEWRYVPVRRLCNMIEESIRQATSPFVFAPNDANTWIKAKAMIENFLYRLWAQGALVGAKTEQAFFVNVGLGLTMTPDDILQGRMIFEVGISAMRPAEFIILRFCLQLQGS
jgi:uncharacterized protein